MCKSLIPIPGAAVLAFIAIIIFLVLLIIVMRPKGDSLKKWLVAYAVIIVAYIGYVCYTCGPNPKDVAIMKPMAEKISEYIIKNGIPKSLKDIPGLPYELECGKHKEEYFVYDNLGRSIKSKKEDAISMSIHESCSFYTENRSYYISAYEEFYLKKYGSSKKAYSDIRIGNSQSKTWDIISFSTSWDNKTTFDNKINFGSSKTDGICNPMRQ